MYNTVFDTQNTMCYVMSFFSGQIDKKLYNLVY